MPGKRATVRQHGRKRTYFVLACVLFALAVSAAWGGRWLTAPQLADFLPSQTPLAGQTDLLWWWNATSDFRRIPEVQKELAQAQETGHFSIDQDVLPWVGQAGGGLIRYDGQKSAILVCLQVKNWPAFLQVMTRARAQMRAKSAVQWSEGTYDGYSLQRALIPASKKRPAVRLEIAMVRDWLLVGVQPGALEAALDTYSGKGKSLASTQTWKAAQARLPARAVSWISLNTDSLVSQMPAAKSAAIGPDARVFALTKFTDEGDGLRWNTIAYPLTTAGRSQTRRTWSGVRALTPADLSRMPNDANVTILVASPKALGTVIARNMKASLQSIPHLSSKEKTNISKLENGAARFLSPFVGHAEASLILRPDTHAGLVVSADTARSSQARKAFRSLVKGGGILPYDKWKARARSSRGQINLYGIQPVALTRGKRLLVASAPAWITEPVGRPRLSFPTGAHNVDIAMLGNFTFLPGLSRLAGDRHLPFGGPFINGLGLQQAQWSYWSGTSPAGAWVQSSARIDHWNWRQAIHNTISLFLADRAQIEQQLKPHPAPQKTPTGLS